MKRWFAFICGIFLLPLTMFAQGSVLLVGGGGEEYNDWSDAPYRWLVEHAPNRSILIMHYSTGSTWLEGYFKWLGADSTASLVVASTAAANDSAVYRRILASDGIFLRGGDQYQYVSKWKGTLAEKAIREVYARGGVVGGTSAGEAVLSQLIFDSRLTSVDPRTALQNPLGAKITFTEDFLGFASGLLADSHFYERGRIGRLIAMIAVYRSTTGAAITGAGVDYNTALAVSPDGKGTVMGSGTVTVLRAVPSTSATLVTGEALSVRDMRLDQLTAGAVLDLKSGAVTLPGNGAPFSPKPFVAPSTKIMVDGGATPAIWCAAGGSLRTLVDSLSAADTVAILGSPSAWQSAQSVDSFLTLRATPHRTLFLSEETNDDVVLAASLARSSAVIVAGLRADSIARHLSGAVGNVFRLSANAGTPLCFLGNDAVLAADSGVGNLVADDYAAYHGVMTALSGTGLLNGISVMPRLYEASAIIDNRASGLFWCLARSGHRFGLLLDSYCVATISGGQLRVSGKTPAMLIDARGVSSASFPQWKDPGRANPRQNGGLYGARVHVIRSGESFDLTAPLSVPGAGAQRLIPSGITLGQNHPNPFNPETVITYSVPAPLRIRLAVHDILGREVAVLKDGTVSAGSHSVPFSGTRLASGIYFSVLTTERGALTKKMLLVR